MFLSANTPLPTPEHRRDRPLFGIGLKVASVLIFLVMASLLKGAEGIPPGELVFFRSFFALLPILIFMAMRGVFPSGLRTAHPFSHLRRGLVGGLAMGCNFFALTQLPLPEAVTITYGAPLLIVVLSAIVLKEAVHIYRWSAVFIGLIGVAIIVSPRLTLLSGGGAALSGAGLGAIAALCGVLFMSFASLAIRELTDTERSATIAFYFMVTATLLSLLTIPFGWVMPTPTAAAMLIGAGITGGIAQILMTESFRHADMSVIAPFEYTSLVFSLLIGLWIFGDVPTWQTLIGASIVVASGIFIIMRERALGIKQAKLRDQSSRLG